MRENCGYWDSLVAGRTVTGHLWVLEYGISMGRLMTIALHRGNYPLADRVVLRWVTHFRGTLEGGPYELSLVKDDAERQRLVGRPMDDDVEPLEIRFGTACCNRSVRPA